MFCSINSPVNTPIYLDHNNNKQTIMRKYLKMQLTNMDNSILIQINKIINYGDKLNLILIVKKTLD